MPESIIVAIIAGVVSLTGTVIAVVASNSIQSKKNAIKEAERETRQTMRLDNIDENIKRLEKKVDIHNGYAEKFGDMRQDIGEVRQDIAVIKNDISYLQDRGKK